MANPQVEELKTLLSDQPKMPLRPDQVDEYQDELSRLTGVTQGRDMDGNMNQGWLGGNKGQAMKTAQRVKKILDEQAPKKITDGKRRDRVAALIQDLEQNVVAPALNSSEAARRNPPGAVGHALKTEFNPAFKDMWLTIRRGHMALDPEDRDEDRRSYDRLRTGNIQAGAGSFMVNAQIPGNFAMTPKARENWPLGEPTADTALKQSARAEKARASLAKARAARSAKRASVVQANAPDGEGT